MHRQLAINQAAHDAAAAAEAAAAAQRAQAAKAYAEAKAAACQADAICTGKEHLDAASSGCRRLAEQEGKHAVRWPDIGLIATFIPVKWGDREHRTITYIGQGEFQNGFGAWTPYVATCEFSIRTDNALFIQLTEGRL